MQEGVCAASFPLKLEKASRRSQEEKGKHGRDHGQDKGKGSMWGALQAREGPNLARERERDRDRDRDRERERERERERHSLQAFHESLRRSSSQK